MDLVSVDDVLSEVLAAGPSHGVVATDADGTLWTGDVGDDLFDAFVEHGELKPEGEERARLLLQDLGVSSAGILWCKEARRAFEEGMLQERAFYEFCVTCFAGHPPDFARLLGKKVANTLRARVIGESARLLAALSAKGWEIWVVSASPAPVVTAAVEALGMVASVVAARAELQDGVFSPKLAEPFPYAEGKVSALRRAVGARPILLALGDNDFDLALLSEAQVPLAVRPKEKLRRRASELATLRELRVEGHGTRS